jgi:CheY-like chemotaxis protein
MPFSQADASTTRQFGGTGLGLSISKRLVRIMGGELLLRSAKGEGAEFYFELIFSTSKIKGESKQDALFLREKIPNDFKVLLVEDNPMNQLYATSILEGYTNNVVVASNGQEAIELLKEDPLFDLVLMDIQMPIMGGEECTEFIRSEMGLNFPIIALTANAFKKDQDKYIEKGMNGYLSKPFEEAELLKIMHAFLPKSSAGSVNV